MSRMNLQESTQNNGPKTEVKIAIIAGSGILLAFVLGSTPAMKKMSADQAALMFGICSIAFILVGALSSLSAKIKLRPRKRIASDLTSPLIEKAIDEAQKLSGEFNPDKRFYEFVGMENEWGVAIDSNNKKICFLSANRHTCTASIYNLSDLIGCEIYVEHKDLKMREIRELFYSNISLRILVNDPSCSEYQVRFFRYRKYREHYRQALRLAEKWKVLLDHKLKQNLQSEDNVIPQAAREALQSSIDQSNSVADELLKLAELLEKGLLTEKEFETQKERLLSL